MLAALLAKDVYKRQQMKYASLAEAASRLMQVLNDPENITG